MSAEEPIYVFDSYAVLAYLEREAGSERVLSILQAVGTQHCRAILSVINLGEVVYIIERERGLAAAQAALAAIDLLPVEVVPATRDAVLAAAHLKANYRIAYTDAFAVAAALAQGGIVVTGDPEFASVDDLIEIEWLPQASS